MKIITINEWFNRNTKKPLLIIVASVFFIQFMFLTFWSIYSKSKQHQQIDQLVRIASHGIKHNNRPLLESILDMGFNELNSSLIVICRQNTVVLAYPVIKGRCTNIQSSIFQSIIIKKAHGNLDYTFYFLIPLLPSLSLWLLLLLITIIILSSGGYLTWRVQKNISKEILVPLQTDFNHDHPMGIKELEDLRQKQRKYTELKVRNATNEAIANLIKHLSHDIRKPLSQVKIMLSAFDMFKNNPSRLNAAKADVEKAINNIQGMLADVMNFSRETQLETKPKALSSIFDFAIRQVVQCYKDKDIDIAFSYDFKATKMPLVDEPRFSRVLSNIIGNGIEAITEIGNNKSGLIDIYTEECKQAEASYIEIMIGNDGPSFPAGVEKKLFESFYTSGKAKGTGLGLASAKKIVELHGGEIFARNKDVGEGVEFVIRLPISNISENIDEDLLPLHSDDVFLPEEDMSAIDVLIQKMEGKVYKVVLLEDEALYRAWVKNLIQSNENLQRAVVLYDATTVDEALQLVAKEEPSFAIVDIDLHNKNHGYDFLKAVKGNLNLKSIVHSNRTLEEFKQKAKDLGASDFVPKPLPLSSLVEFLIGEKIEEREKQKKESVKQIYACDDTQLIREHLEHILNEYLQDNSGAFEFELFENGEELIKRTKKIRPNLVFTDLNMRESGGQLDGYEVIKSVKKISRKIKAYLISNEPLMLSEEPTKKAGGDGALEQPLNKEIIFSLIDKWITSKLG